MKTVAIAGSFDTKSTEYLYAKDLIESLELNTYIIHTGVSKSTFKPDISREEVVQAAGGDIKVLAQKKDIELTSEVLSKGMENLIPKLYEQGKFNGIIFFAGSKKTSLITPAMKALPIDVPKLMISRVSSENTSQYVGKNDLIMMPTIVDVDKSNFTSTKIAVFTIAEMVKFENN
ncbi:Tm-1-like ATP-binding domain-containing protein [Terrisporobacter mayombei]|uniref:UPF0261 domain-containing protein n=1 Tax=Terrisporobacter mayombei TaxID=1541 RepID=A0ABY9PZJ4_9FIRM|nr:Tm-1-like ATP-binding domain-containing protein [Terrisporobacter mayombei]WMT80789.1 hypothetical protein TEMA_11110 [Terrisporobacter mayombei]